MAILFGMLFLFALITSVLVFSQLRSQKSKHDALLQEYNVLTDRFRPVLDANAEKPRILAELRVEQQRVLEELTAKRQQVNKELEIERARTLGNIFRIEAEKK